MPERRYIAFQGDPDIGWSGNVVIHTHKEVQTNFDEGTWSKETTTVVELVDCELVSSTPHMNRFFVKDE